MGKIHNTGLMLFAMDKLLVLMDFTGNKYLKLMKVSGTFQKCIYAFSHQISPPCM